MKLLYNNKNKLNRNNISNNINIIFFHKECFYATSFMN